MVTEIPFSEKPDDWSELSNPLTLKSAADIIQTLDRALKQYALEPLPDGRVVVWTWARHRIKRAMGSGVRYQA